MKALTALVIAMAFAAFVAAAAQQQPAKTWTQPRTPDGQLDLQGIWTNYTSTPFEVPDSGDKPDFYAGDVDGTGRGTGPSSFLTDTSDRKLTKAKSLVVDPPTGRVPIMPWAEEVRNYRLTHIQDDWVNFTPWERCITRGVPGGIFPAGYGSGYQILQGPGYVVVQNEMIHESRVIPIDAKTPRLGQNIHLYLGDPRGHWEGSTLVVDSTNFNGKPWFALGGDFMTDAAHVVERFTMKDANTLVWQATITDPKAYTRPWTMQSAAPYARGSEAEMLEDSCHEGNADLVHLKNNYDAARAGAKK